MRAGHRRVAGRTAGRDAAGLSWNASSTCCRPPGSRRVPSAPWAEQAVPHTGPPAARRHGPAQRGWPRRCRPAEPRSPSPPQGSRVSLWRLSPPAAPAPHSALPGRAASSARCHFPAPVPSPGSARGGDTPLPPSCPGRSPFPALGTQRLRVSVPSHPDTPSGGPGCSVDC